MILRLSSRAPPGSVLVNRALTSRLRQPDIVNFGMLHFRSLGSRRGLVERGPATWLAGLAEARLTVLTPCAQGAVDGHAGDAKGMRNFELGGVAEVSNLSHAVQAGGFVAGGMAVDDIER